MVFTKEKLCDLLLNQLLNSKNVESILYDHDLVNGDSIDLNNHMADFNFYLSKKMIRAHKESTINILEFGGYPFIKCCKILAGMKESLNEGYSVHINYTTISLQSIEEQQKQWIKYDVHHDMINVNFISGDYNDVENTKKELDKINLSYDFLIFDIDPHVDVKSPNINSTDNEIHKLYVDYYADVNLCIFSCIANLGCWMNRIGEYVIDKLNKNTYRYIFMDYTSNFKDIYIIYDKNNEFYNDEDKNILDEKYFVKKTCNNRIYNNDGIIKQIFCEECDALNMCRKCRNKFWLCLP